jgi:peptidyl-tRNA hydrolase, PTH1 family
MYLLVGLGNPGKKYEKTRHNVGFMVVDEFAKQHSFPDFALSKKHATLVSEGVLNQVRVILMKPQTFMNNSGKAVASLVSLRFLKLSETKELAKELVVVHDDIDIPLGKIRISQGRGSAGHKGVESIIQSLGTKNFARIRIGIQPVKGKPKDVETFVLQAFKKTELPLLESAIDQTTESLLSVTTLRRN